MTDAPPSVTTDEASPWLSPSEALTRFVPQTQAQLPQARQSASVRFGFRVGEIGLLVPMGMLSELVEQSDIYPVPTTPAWFPGLINLRGDLVPVFDLTQLFNMQGSDAQKSKLLVLNTGAEAVSVLIDGLPQALDISRYVKQSPPLPEMLQEHNQAVYVQDQDIWVDFDFDAFFRATGGRIVA